MDWPSIPQVGWATAVTMLAAVAGMVLLRRWSDAKEKRERYERELQKAKREYREAVASRDPDWIALAARKLRRVRTQS